MFLRYNIAGILWAILIFILCSIPGYSIPHYHWADLISFDKFVHAFLFAVLTALLMRGFKKQDQFILLQKKTVTLVLITCIAYGGVLELMQNYLFVQRSGSWFDFIANTIGCVTGIKLYNFFKKRDIKIFGVSV